MFDEKLTNKVKKNIQSMGISPTDSQLKSWMEYLLLLQKWNKTYKMTSITDLNKMLILHLYDSLSISEYIIGDRSIDVGTGGGLPGVILAILLPEHHFTLVDSVGKKISFLNHIKHKCQLDNIFPVNVRIESYNPTSKFDNVISRAFSSLDSFYKLCKHLPNHEGQFLAMKGRLLGDDKLNLSEREPKVFSLKVPELDAERHLIRF